VWVELKDERALFKMIQLSRRIREKEKATCC
jgi:hypothetical protein